MTEWQYPGFSERIGRGGGGFQTLPIDFLITKKDKKVPTLDKLVPIVCAVMNMR